MYKLRNLAFGGQDVIRLLDSVYIPFDPANTDYQAFLKYQAEGGKVYGADEEVPVINTPLPADSTP
jgi:hypothetical protein